MVRLYRINKLQYDSRITVTNHKLCQTGSVAESRLRLPCPIRWNFLCDSLVNLTKHIEKLHQLMNYLSMPPFKTTEIDFLCEYVDVTAPIEALKIKGGYVQNS